MYGGEGEKLPKFFSPENVSGEAVGYRLNLVGRKNEPKYAFCKSVLIRVDFYRVREFLNSCLHDIYQIEFSISMRFVGK